MIRDVSETPIRDLYGSTEVSKEVVGVSGEWLDNLDRQDQIWMLQEIRGRISSSEFNFHFDREDSNNHYEVVDDLEEDGLVVKISNSELQPESTDEYFKENRDGEDNWYHLTPLGLEFVRSIFDEDGPQILAPLAIAEDLKKFVRGVPDESRRTDEHLVRTDVYETEGEFDTFRSEVREGQHNGELAPPVITDDPYLLSREMTVKAWEGEGTDTAALEIQEKLTNFLDNHAKARLFSPYDPLVPASEFNRTFDPPNGHHKFIVGRSFIESANEDDEGGREETFLEESQNAPHLRVETLTRYLPYLLGIFEDEDQANRGLLIYGKANPDDDSYRMLATVENPDSALYNWAEELFQYIKATANDYDGN